MEQKSAWQLSAEEMAQQLTFEKAYRYQLQQELAQAQQQLKALQEAKGNHEVIMEDEELDHEVIIEEEQ